MKKNVLKLKMNRRRILRMMALGAGSAALVSSMGPLKAVGRTTDTVRLTYARGGGNITLLAKERGELEKHLAAQGIKVEWVGPFPSHAPSMQAVVGGSADFSFGGSTTPGLAAILAGSPLVFSQFYIYLPRTTAIIAKDPAIKGPQDLVGKSVAVNRSGLGEMLLIAGLEKHRVDVSKVNVVYLNPPDAGPALAAGKVDAWAMWSPAVDIARQNYNAHNIYEEKDLDYLLDFSTFLIARSFAVRNPDLVRAVNEAFILEGQWASGHTTEVENICQKTGKYSDEVRDFFISLKRTYQFYPPNDVKFLADFQKAADWLSSHGVLPGPITVSEHVAQL
ncbi:MAG: NrtA/SsuA/CpmA family ABC transporter substrate-binding protein [Desulfovibrio sp.]|jgi:sulfonate transport system substrate-binding protein|nr:NrtA/SsuA/CpmA family ABC transporter substrate-binding protein [Desulfovibrio sp.]